MSRHTHYLYMPGYKKNKQCVAREIYLRSSLHTEHIYSPQGYACPRLNKLQVAQVRTRISGVQHVQLPENLLETGLRTQQIGIQHVLTGLYARAF
jgi:hypothetical protein